MHHSKIKVRKFMRDSLHEKWVAGKGHPKTNKDIHNSTPYIHSNQTFRTYRSQCDHYADWLKAQGITDVDTAWTLIPNYLKDLTESGKSAWTVSTAMNALAKAWGVSTSEIHFTAPKRERAAIKRSRYAAIRDKHFSELDNIELMTIAQCSGLRRHEMAALHGDQLSCTADGTLVINNVVGKGGRVRNVELHGTSDELKLVYKVMRAAGTGKVFNHIHSAFDEHHCRAEYACRCYRSKARPLDTLNRDEKYCCRKDMAGTVLDRDAMLYTSRQLGHNRIDVVANNYLYNL